MQRVKAASQLGDPLVEMRHWLYSFLQPAPQAPATARWLAPMPMARTAKPTISAQFNLRPSTFVFSRRSYTLRPVETDVPKVPWAE